MLITKSKKPISKGCFLNDSNYMTSYKKQITGILGVRVKVGL